MPPMSARRQITILNAKGLHMRPATRFVALAAKFQSEVRVVGNGKDVDGKSILDMTTLAAECGSQLEIRASGTDAEDAVSALTALVEAQFHMLADGDHDPVDPRGAS
jgi:phosphocarrier protein HPr